MGGDEQIVGADHGAALLQVGTDLRVVLGGTVWEVDGLDVGEERRERVASCARRGDTSTPYEQFRLGDDRDADVLYGTLRRRFITSRAANAS